MRTVTVTRYVTPLREGDTLAGWTLVSVYPDKVVIRSGGAEQEILIADTLKMNDSLARRRAGAWPPRASPSPAAAPPAM